MFKKNTLLIVLVLSVLNLGAIKAQVTIGGTSDPKSYSLLELQTNSVKGGLQLPRLDQSAIDNLMAAHDWDATEAKGLVVFNLTTSCVNTWDGASWLSVCGAPDVASLKAFPVISGSTCGGVLFELDSEILDACNLYAGSKNITYSVNWEVKSELYETQGSVSDYVPNKTYRVSGFNGSACYAVFETNKVYFYEKIYAKVSVTFSDGTVVHSAQSSNGVDAQGFLPTNYGESASDDNVLSGVNCFNVKSFYLDGSTVSLTLKNKNTGNLPSDINASTVRWTIEDSRRYLDVNVNDFKGNYALSAKLQNTHLRYGTAIVTVSYTDNLGCNYQKSITLTFSPDDCCPSFYMRGVEYPTLKVNKMCWMTVYATSGTPTTYFNDTVPSHLDGLAFYNRTDAATACPNIVGVQGQIFKLPSFEEFEATVAYIDSHVETYADLDYTPNIPSVELHNIMSQTQHASSDSYARLNRGRSKPAPDGLDLLFTGRATKTNPGTEGNLILEGTNPTKNVYVGMVPTDDNSFPLIIDGYEKLVDTWDNAYPIRCIYNLP